MRMPKFSYSHTEMVARDCNSLKMKLMGGRRTARVPVSFARAELASGHRTFSSTTAWEQLAAVDKHDAITTTGTTTYLHVQSYWASKERMKTPRVV